MSLHLTNYIGWDYHAAALDQALTHLPEKQRTHHPAILAARERTQAFQDLESNAETTERLAELTELMLTQNQDLPALILEYAQTELKIQTTSNLWGGLTGAVRSRAADALNRPEVINHYATQLSDVRTTALTTLTTTSKTLQGITDMETAVTNGNQAELQAFRVALQTLADLNAIWSITQDQEAHTLRHILAFATPRKGAPNHAIATTAKHFAEHPTQALTAIAAGTNTHWELQPVTTQQELTHRLTT